MKPKEKKLSKKEIEKAFKKLGIGNDQKDEVSEWMRKSDFTKLNEEDIWVISDSTSSFAHYNQ